MFVRVSGALSHLGGGGGGGGGTLVFQLPTPREAAREEGGGGAVGHWRWSEMARRRGSAVHGTGLVTSAGTMGLGSSRPRTVIWLGWGGENSP